MACHGEFYNFSSSLSLKNGSLFCEEVNVNGIQKQLEEHKSETSTSFIVYSKKQLTENVLAYSKSLEEFDVPYILGYSVKANYNASVLNLFKDLGCTAIAVGGNEIKLAVQVGMDPEKIVYNGNGKKKWETELAVSYGCFLNIDSMFDLNHTIAASKKLKKQGKIILRLNPDIDSQVHPYLATGLSKSKFGIEDSQLQEILDEIKREPAVKLVGLHCHLGSTIKTTNVFVECLDVMLILARKIKENGFDGLEYLNLGGGLGIDYTEHSERTHYSEVQSTTNGTQDKKKVPLARDLIKSVERKIKESGMILILEPGRSLIGNAAIYYSQVIGWKRSGRKNYLVVDGSMNEIIRPSLYDAYHHIEFTEPVKGPGNQDNIDKTERKLFDVVGPICECADFLGLERWLPVPHEGCGLCVFDVGAYCGSMSGNYNLRCRPAEILVDESSWEIIRKAETLDDIMRNMPLHR